MDCIRSGRKPAAGGDDARVALQMALAANRSIQTGMAVEVPTPRPPA